MKKSEFEIVESDMLEENQEKSSEIVSHKNVTVSQLLQKNNELLEYHNNILIENKKITNMNSITSILFKLVLMAAIVVFCFFLYKIYTELVISNQKETTIVNNMPQQEAAVVTVNVPETNVAVNNIGSKDKVSFYRGGYSGFVYRSTSKTIVYCRTASSEKLYDAILSPNSIVEFTSEIVTCKDADLVEIRDPSKPQSYQIPNNDLFKL